MSPPNSRSLQYKQCCLEKHETARRTNDMAEAEHLKATQKEQDKLIRCIEKAFGLLSSQQYDSAIRFASKLITRYPNEDRLHDIISTSHLYAGECDAAI